MKYIVLLLLGLIGTQAVEQKAITQLQVENGVTAAESSESDSDDDETNVQLDGDDGIIDALTPQKGACVERLWISQDELDW